MADKPNLRKSEFLGMNHGTAGSRLRKLVLFGLCKELGKNVCFRCEKEIKSVEELSIDHKEPWLHVDVDLFWDLDNVAFSHLGCNTAHRRQFSRGCPPEMWWCRGCRKCVNQDEFSPGMIEGARKIGEYTSHCRKCNASRQRGKRSRRKASVETEPQ